MCRFASPAAMVKPEKARRVEEMLMHAAKSGALGGKVTEGQFIQMLEQVKSKEYLRQFQEHCSNDGMCLRGRTNDTGTAEGNVDTAVGVRVICEGLWVLVQQFSFPNIIFAVRKRKSSHHTRVYEGGAISEPVRLGGPSLAQGTTFISVSGVALPPPCSCVLLR